MIPRVINYCWFGRNPLPPLAIKCIESWRKYFPGYEIKEWNEDNFDVNIIPYTKEAYQAKKYAFVSDYARFWILYKYGGLYFDTDVEVIRPMDEIITCGPYMGCETEINENGVTMLAVNPGLGLAVDPGLELYMEFLDKYAGLSFCRKDGSYNQKTIVSYTSEVLYRHGVKCVKKIQKCAGVFIYPKEYFCPLDYQTKKLEITINTYTIHHFDSSWMSEIDKYAKYKAGKIKFLPHKIVNYVFKFIAVLKYKGFCSAVNEIIIWFKRYFKF